MLLQHKHFRIHLQRRPEVKPDAGRIDQIFRDCLYREEEIADGKVPEEAVIVDAIRGKFGFNPPRLEGYRKEIIDQLSGLPDQFREDKGGGWSFLNGAMNSEDEQWGEQINVEQLLALGIAIGRAKIQLPREVWSALPGGVPYFSVDVSEPV